MGNCNPRKTRNRVVQEIVPHEGVTWKDCEPYVPKFTKGRVIKVYDGDTIHVAAYPNNVYPQPGRKIPRFSIRLLRIDAPEIRTKNVEEKEHAYIARRFLSAEIMGKVVELRNVVREPKWGRILAEVYHQDKNMSDMMLEEHLAVPYSGKTKQSPDSWAAYYASR